MKRIALLKQQLQEISDYSNPYMYIAMSLGVYDQDIRRYWSNVNISTTTSITSEGNKEELVNIRNETLHVPSIHRISPWLVKMKLKFPMMIYSSLTDNITLSELENIKDYLSIDINETLNDEQFNYESNGQKKGKRNSKKSKSLEEVLIQTANI